MVKQCTILFGCLALGDFVVWATGVKLPGSIIGMLLLTAFLQMGWVKLRWVKGISDFLVSNMGFFFDPICKKAVRRSIPIMLPGNFTPVAHTTKSPKARHG